MLMNDVCYLLWVSEWYVLITDTFTNMELQLHFTSQSSCTDWFNTLQHTRIATVDYELVHPQLKTYL